MMPFFGFVQIEWLAPLPLEVTASKAKSALEFAALHPTRTVSRIVSAGRPRKKSARLSSKIKSIASIKFAFVFSIVSPCPFAPGTSGQIAQYPPSGAGSMIAVNSDFIW